MRIGIDALAVTPDRPGGDVTYVVELARRCPSIGFDDEWVVFESPGTQAVIGELPRNVRRVVCNLPHGSTVVRALWEQAVLPKLAHGHGIDVLFAPVNVAPVAYTGRVVLTLHEAEPFQPDNQIPAPLLAWWRVMRQLSARRATRILTVSEAARQQLQRWMSIPANRMEVIQLGVDRNRFVAEQPTTLVPLDGAPYLLWVGRPYPRKGLKTLLSAFAQLRSQGRTERLVLIGPPGWDEAGLLARIHAEFEPGVVLRLPAAWAQLPAWYRAASAFVFPSRQETFGLPVLEAMACGTPVVASNIDALVEVGGDAALYFTRGDSLELADKLKTVLTNHAMRAALTAGGLRRAATFDWQTTAVRTYHQLRAAADRSQRAAA